MKNKLITAIIFLALLPIVSASLGVFKQNDCVPIRVLANCTSVNLTEVTVNNANSFLINDVMTLSGGQTFNYSFCNTSELGTYSYSWNNPCVDCSSNDCGNSFEITISGTDTSTSQGIMYVVFIILSFGIFILCVYGAIVIPWGNITGEQNEIIGIGYMKYLKLVCIVFAYITLMFSIGLVRGVAYNFLTVVGVYGMFEWIYYLMLVLLYPLIVCSFLFALLKYLNDKKLMKALIRGVPER